MGRGDLFEQIVQVHNFTEQDAAIIMKQLFSSVFYKHSKGEVHRDLKPENILIQSAKNEKMWIKIIDFGTSNNFTKSTKFTYKIGTTYLLLLKFSKCHILIIVIYGLMVSFNIYF